MFKVGAKEKIILFISYVACFGAFFQFFNLGAVPQKVLIVALTFLLLFLRIPRVNTQFAASITIFCALVLYSFASGILFFQSISKALFATQGLIYCIAYFIVGACTTVNRESSAYFRNGFLFILILQLIAVFGKLFVFGIDEANWIGTLAHGTGQLSVLFPLLCVPVVCNIFKDNYLTLSLGIVCLFLFGIIGEKRAIVFLMPIFALYCLYKTNGVGVLRFARKKSAVVISLVVVTFGILGVTAIPSLNSEVSRSFQGSFAPSFVIGYAADYLTMDYGGSLQGPEELAATDKNIQVGRITLWAYVLDWFLEADVTTKIFGLGYGAITPSIWLHDSTDLLFDTIGVRGALSGANFVLLELGALGLLLQISFLMASYRAIRDLKRRAHNGHVISYLSILELMFPIFLFDYFFYSTVLLNALPLPFILFAGLGIGAAVTSRGSQDGYYRAE